MKCAEEELIIISEKSQRDTTDPVRDLPYLNVCPVA
jgi:hypothetical protein